MDSRKDFLFIDFFNVAVGVVCIFVDCQVKRSQKVISPAVCDGGSAFLIVRVIPEFSLVVKFFAFVRGDVNNGRNDIEPIVVASFGMSFGSDFLLEQACLDCINYSMQTRIRYFFAASILV